MTDIIWNDPSATIPTSTEPWGTVTEGGGVSLESLREQGYLVLAPGDTSPLGELVRAIVERDYCDLPTAVFVRAKQDPAVREWAARAKP